MADGGIPPQEQRANFTFIKEGSNDNGLDQLMSDDIVTDSSLNADCKLQKNEERSQTKTENKYALLSDDWGKSVINQNKAWDLPPSPQPSGSVWSATGTEIWENSDKQTKAIVNHWGHTPSTHIGGTWGEEEDSTNVWMGPPNHVKGFNGPNPSSDNGTSLWGNTANKVDGGGLFANPNTGANSAVGAFTPVTNSPNNNTPNVMNPAGNVALKKDKGNDASSSASTFGTWGPVATMGFNKNDIQPTGWDDDSGNKKRSTTVASPSSTSAPGNFDDGTSVWGNPDRHNKVSRWKETPNAKSANSANGNNNDATSSNMMNSPCPEVSSPSPGMIRLPPGAHGLSASSNNATSNTNCKLMGNGLIIGNNAQSGCNLMGDAHSDENNSGILNTPNVLGTDVWSSSKPLNRGWNDSLLVNPSTLDCQSSNNIAPKTSTIPASNATGVRDPRDSSSFNPQGSVSWGVKNDNTGAIKSVPGTPNTPNVIGGGWGADISAGSLPYWNKPRSNNWLSGEESDGNNWNGPKSAKQQANKDQVNSNKVYRLLLDMGVKKEDIDNALRSRGLSENDLRALPSRDNEDIRGGISGSLSNTPSSLNTVPPVSTTSLSSIMTRSPSYTSQPMQPPQHAATSQPTQHHLTNVQPPSQQTQDPSQLRQQLNLAISNQLSPQAPLQQSPNALPSVKQVQNVLKNRNAVSGQPNLPSEKQLLHLVQQIQLAVQSGHLNAQILNQPLAYNTIHLINQLLQNIKTLQQLQIQAANQQKNGGPMNNSSQSSLHVQITQTKLRIQNLQNQITIQQAMFLKQQHQPGHQGNMPGTSQLGVGASQLGVVPLPPNNQSQTGGQSQPPTSSHQQTQHKQIPPIAQSNHAQEVIQSGLDSGFRDLTIKDFGPQHAGQANTSNSGSGGMPASPPNARNGVHSQQSHQNQQNPKQSRLQTTWKLAGYEREDAHNVVMNSDFMRAPGPMKQSNSNNLINRNSDNSGNSWPNILQSGNSDVNAWPSDTVMNVAASSPVASSANSGHSSSGANASSELKDIVSNSNSLQPQYTINDLVTEFEPGKPWKGTASKIEDDPHITPGSVTRSPLSMRDIPMSFAGIFTNWPPKGPGPATVPSDNLSSLNLTSSTWAFNPNTNTGWGSIANDAPSSSGPESPWNGSISKPRGPPPGLGQDRNVPRGDASLQGIRPQANPLDWTFIPSNDGDQLSAVANANIDSKDIMFSRMMASGGIDLGMSIGMGGASRNMDDSASLGLKSNLALNRCNSTNPMIRNDMGIQQGINQEDGNWQLSWPSYMQ